MKILLDNIVFPEGPAFDYNGTIWLVEKDGENIISIDNEIITRHSVNGNPNGIAIDNDNNIWFCDSKQNAIRVFNPSSHQIINIVNKIDGEALKMPNDLAFDQNNNLLFTCPGDNLLDKSGYICCYSKDKSIIKVSSNLQYPNGLAFTRDFKQLYIAETGTHLIWKFDWDSENKSLSNKTKWAETGGPIGPDGIAIDEEENVYIAVYGSSTVKVFNKSGVIIEEIHTLGANPTNCAIDPKGIKGLLITEAELGILIQIPLNKRGIL